MNAKVSWRPLDTAPRDGTIILLNDVHCGVVAGWFDRADKRHPWRFFDNTEIVFFKFEEDENGAVRPNGFAADRPLLGWLPLDPDQWRQDP